MILRTKEGIERVLV